MKENKLTQGNNQALTDMATNLSIQKQPSSIICNSKAVKKDKIRKVRLTTRVPKGSANKMVRN